MTTRIAPARAWIVLIIVLAPAFTAGCSGDDAAATGASATTGSSTGGSASATTTSSGTSTTATASSGSGGAPPTTPALSVVFPPSGATAEESIVVRGTSSYDGTVSSVTVNDAPATSSDGFASWRAEIPLAAGDNSVDVRMKNDMGEELAAPVTIVLHRFPDNGSVTRGTGFDWASTNLRGMDVDADATFAVIADSNYDGLFRIDLASGERSWATCSESTPACEGGGDGFAMVDPTDVVLAGSAGQAIVPDGDVIVAVDLATKNRSVVSDSTT